MPTKNYSKNVITLLSFFVLSTHSAADLMLDEHALLIDIPTVTSATRLTQHLSDAPVSMTVIDRATIQASGAQTVPDLFRLVPGFQVAHVNTNKYAVTYHGHSDDFPRRLEVMIDGRSVYMPLISSPDWTSLGLHLDDIEKIEIVRGSNTATHGSNAFLGAINIITRHPSTESKASGSVTLGSLDTSNSNARFGGLTPIGHYRLSYGYEENSGSRQFSDGARRNYLNFSGSFAPSTQDQIEIRTGIDRGYTTIGSLKASETPNSIVTKERDYSSNFQHLIWNRTVNDSLSIEVAGYRNELTLKEQAPSFEEVLKSESYEAYTIWMNNPEIFDNCLLLPIEYIDDCNAVNDSLNAFNSTPSVRLNNENGSTRQEDLQVSGIYTHTNLSSIIGLGYRKDIGEGRTLFDNGNISTKRYRVFFNSVYNPSPIYTINLGALHENEESRSEATSLRTALNVHITNNLTLRTGLSHSERLPSLFESYGETTYYYDGLDNEIYNAIRRPNQNLNPEKVNSKEVGLLYNFQNINGNLDIRIFNEKITQGIETYRIILPLSQVNGSNTTRIEKNISSWENNGAELQLKIQPKDNLWLLLNYTYINSTKDGFNNGSRFITRNHLAPRHSASALVSWKPTSDLQLSAAHYYVDQMHWFEGDIREAYNRTDLRAAKSWTPSSQTQAEAALVIQNAFGPTYKEFYDYHDFEHRIFLTFRLKYD